MGLSIRQRWMLYGLAGLLTAAAMVAVGPAPDDASPVAPAAAPAARRPGAHAVPAGPPRALAPLPARPYGGAGRSPFGEPPAVTAADTAAAAAAQSAAAAVPRAPPPVVAVAAPALPFGFLGRWTEHGVTTVFLSSGGRSLSAVAGRHLTPDYLVEHIGERELQLRHVPTGQRHTLALVAAGPAAAAATGAPAARNDTEESN